MIKRNADGLYKNAEDPQRTWNSISKGVVALNKPKMGGSAAEQDRSQAKRRFGPDGKRKTGYQINPLTPHIDLKDVAEADSNNIRDRMINLEKQFHKIPANQL
jgi:hypothetical protein